MKLAWTFLFVLAGIGCIVSIPILCVPAEDGGQDGVQALGSLFLGFILIAGGIVNYILWDVKWR
jgi:hypothetical protein